MHIVDSSCLGSLMITKLRGWRILTTMTGQRSLTETYANEALSDVQYGAAGVYGVRTMSSFSHNNIYSENPIRISYPEQQAGGTGGRFSLEIYPAVLLLTDSFSYSSTS